MDPCDVYLLSAVPLVAGLFLLWSSSMTAMRRPKSGRVRRVTVLAIAFIALATLMVVVSALAAGGAACRELLL